MDEAEDQSQQHLHDSGPEGESQSWPRKVPWVDVQRPPPPSSSRGSSIGKQRTGGGQPAQRSPGLPRLTWPLVQKYEHGRSLGAWRTVYSRRNEPAGPLASQGSPSLRTAPRVAVNRQADAP